MKLTRNDTIAIAIFVVVGIILMGVFARNRSSHGHAHIHNSSCCHGHAH